MRPICLRCRRNLEQEVPLTIGSVLREAGDTILEGLLVCSNQECPSEYPIIDGIPIILADLRAYVSHNISEIRACNDLSATMESLLGDCCGPGSVFDVQRQILSGYAFDHYGDLDPDEPAEAPALPGSAVRLLKEGLRTLTGSVRGPVIDIGCAVGRTSCELAEKTGEIVLGVDLNFGMLKTAARVLRHGSVGYPRRRVGIVYDRREFPVTFNNAHKVDFWVCDAVDLPFAEATFGLAISLNVIDCVNAPIDHLGSVARILASGAKALVSSPYDWSGASTPLECWLGGHSQRSESRGSSENMLHSLLAGGTHPLAIQQLKLVSEVQGHPWSVRLHDRSFVQYRVHTLVVEKTTK